MHFDFINLFIFDNIFYNYKIFILLKLKKNKILFFFNFFIEQRTNNNLIIFESKLNFIILSNGKYFLKNKIL